MLLLLCACQPRDLFLTLVGKDVLYTPPINHKEVPSSDERTEWANRIWHETTNAKNPLAERYLRNRGITLEIPADIRFHPGLKHKPTNQIIPAMVSAIRNVKGEIQAIHRTYLDLDGQKAKVITPKMSLGPLQGCAIQLVGPSEILGLAEGIETALSAMQMSELPVWCAVNAGNMREVLLPDSVSEVVIFADNGGPGVKAATDAAAIFSQEGRKVRIAYPPDGYGDFNDLLMKGGEA